jgi:hypothetical protein
VAAIVVGSTSSSLLGSKSWAAAGIKFGFNEQWLTTTHTSVRAGRSGGLLAGVGRLSAFLPGHSIDSA